MRDHAFEPVGPERAALAGFVPVRCKHHMLHHELAASLEQITERYLAVGPVAYVILVDLDPWQRTALLGQALARFGVFLFMRKVGLASGNPLLAGDDGVHVRLLRSGQIAFE